MAETNATHLFLVTGGAVLTGHTVACPEGITRAAVLGLCREHGVPCVEKDLSLTEVYRADEAFCTGTMGEIAPVTRVDGRPIGVGAIGPVALKLAGLFRELTAREGVRVVD